jgi:hypothetical protein
MNIIHLMCIENLRILRGGHDARRRDMLLCDIGIARHAFDVATDIPIAFAEE